MLRYGLRRGRIVKSAASVARSAAQRQTTIAVTNSTPNFGPWGFTRLYRGPLQAAILDWSGTTADNFVIAPAYAFVKVFQEFKVPITMEEARSIMGLHKKLHIRGLLQNPDISARWEKIKGRKPDMENDTNEMFQVFNGIQIQCLPEYSKLIPGTAETVHTLRRQFHLKIGGTTGFTRDMVNVLAAEAKKQGYAPDTEVAADEVSMPRPYPYMVFTNMMKLGMLITSSILKVDDTVSGIGEGLNAGTWTCGLSHTSNYMNINKINHGLSKSEFETRGQRSREILLASGAHYVVPDITHLPSVVQDINRRLSNGEKPP